jgi:hypothetical protein
MPQGRFVDKVNEQAFATGLYATFASELSKRLTSMRSTMGANSNMEMVAGSPG